jgi:anti-sigma factor RsiW
MNCEHVENNLMSYVDGQLHPGRRREMEAHLAACAGCRQRARDFRQVWEVLDELPAISPSPAFDSQVRARVATEPRHRGLWIWLVPTPRFAFAVSALLLVSVWLSSFQPARLPVRTPVQNSEAEFGMIKDLPVLEDYDVLADFEALSELPAQPPVPQQP